MACSMASEWLQNQTTCAGSEWLQGSQSYTLGSTATNQTLLMQQTVQVASGNYTAMSGSETATQIANYIHQFYYQHQVTVRYNVGGVTYQNCCVAEPETDEERTEREKREAVEKLERDAADQRAEELLLSLLTVSQREQFIKDQSFELMVQDRRYRLRKHDRVLLLDDKGERQIGYCIHPPYEYHLPGADVLVAQKLLLETDEAKFLAIANATHYANPSLNAGLAVPPLQVAVPYPDELAGQEADLFAQQVELAA